MSDCRFTCTSCDKYDKENHYCPTYCDLIRHTMNERVQVELEQIEEEFDEEYKSNYNIDNVTHCKYKTIVEKHITDLKKEIDETYFDLIKENKQ